MIIACGQAARSQGPQNGSNDIPGALAGVHLIAPVADGQWTMPAGDYGNTRYSPLSNINTSNVGESSYCGDDVNRHPAWP